MLREMGALPELEPRRLTGDNPATALFPMVCDIILSPYTCRPWVVGDYDCIFPTCTVHCIQLLFIWYVKCLPVMFSPVLRPVRRTHALTHSVHSRILPFN